MNVSSAIKEFITEQMQSPDLTRSKSMAEKWLVKEWVTTKREIETDLHTEDVHLSRELTYKDP